MRPPRRWPSDRLHKHSRAIMGGCARIGCQAGRARGWSGQRGREMSHGERGSDRRAAAAGDGPPAGGGADVSTGNTVSVGAGPSRKVSTAQLLRNWGIVYLGNFVGALGTAAMI